ncbi:MAG TPA: hypothetical protein VJT11_07865 [Nitrospiraceae bacterium]|nr:hypothetical protein [Nitrospiraceae bacterium]
MRLTVILLLLLYFGIFLVPKVSPSFGESAVFFTYFFSLFVVLGILALIGVWGTIGIVRSRLHREQVRSRHKFLVLYSVLGFVCFGFVIALGLVIPRPLPSGSDQLKLDSSLWIRPESSRFVEGDITPRQKMLGDAVAALPGKTKSEIEALLGPSLETPYFADTGRDMIYMLGPERDYLAMDSDWLLIWLDGNGQFVRYKIASD